MICANCRQPEGIAHRIGNDGLCEDCRLLLAAIQVASKRHCASCGAPEETPEGIIDLDENGLCDDCGARQERAQIYTEDVLVSLDFNYAMNY